MKGRSGESPQSSSSSSTLFQASCQAQPQRPCTLGQDTGALSTRGKRHNDKGYKSESYKDKRKHQQRDTWKGQRDKSAQPEFQQHSSTCGVWGRSTPSLSSMTKRCSECTSCATTSSASVVTARSCGATASVGALTKDDLRMMAVSSSKII